MAQFFDDSRRWQRLLGRLLLVGCFSTVTLPAWAEEGDDRAKRAQIISRTTMSPFCPGRTLESCPSPYATEWREDIRKMVDKGMTTDQIRAELETRTQTDLTGSPTTMMDGVLPALVTLAAVLLLVFLLRAMVKGRREEISKMPEEPAVKADAANAAGTSDDKKLDERLRAELDEMDADSLDS